VSGDWPLRASLFTETHNLFRALFRSVGLKELDFFQEQRRAPLRS
jgi:hypothetical protein